jgi:ABC-type sugar transport system ATPase subunit
LKQRGVGIVYISHRLDEIFAIADHVTVLRDGAYVGSRAVAETSVSELVQMMVGRRLESLFPKTVAPIGAPVLEARDLVRRPMIKASAHRASGRDRRPCWPCGFCSQQTRAGFVRYDAERVRRD